MLGEISEMRAKKGLLTSITWTGLTGSLPLVSAGGDSALFVINTPFPAALSTVLIALIFASLSGCSRQLSSSNVQFQPSHGLTSKSFMEERNLCLSRKGNRSSCPSAETKGQKASLNYYLSPLITS